MLVSIILPVHNGGIYLEQAFESILKQSWRESLEVSIFNDASTDGTADLCKLWIKKFEKDGIKVVIGHNSLSQPGGVGYAKNQAILQSSGSYLCFLDADDIMMNERIELQLNIAKQDNSLIVGSCYIRIPEGSTERYTAWNNGLSNEQLYTQIYTSFGPTIINPTWFCSREVFQKVGKFSEVGIGYPEDLDFFYRHLECDGKLYKVDKPLLVYRYHSSSATFSISENTIWDMRIAKLQKDILNSWSSFTIWNAGKQGRKFFRSLSKNNRDKVIALCDVDEKKIQKKYYTCELIKGDNGKPLCVPVIHFKDAKQPLIICIKLNLTSGMFEKNLKSLNLIEGKDYFHFN